jgi:hypothetical protein
MIAVSGALVVNTSLEFATIRRGRRPVIFSKSPATLRAAMWIATGSEASWTMAALWMGIVSRCGANVTILCSRRARQPAKRNNQTTIDEAIIFGSGNAFADLLWASFTDNSL